MASPQGGIWGQALSSFEHLFCLRPHVKDQAGEGNHCTKVDGRDGKKWSQWASNPDSVPYQLGDLMQVNSTVCASISWGQWLCLSHRNIEILKLLTHRVWWLLILFNMIYYNSCLWRAPKLSISKTVSISPEILLIHSTNIMRAYYVPRNTLDNKADKIK